MEHQASRPQVTGWRRNLVVWIDHQGYKQQRHKQCAFNLFTAGVIRRCLVPMAELLGETRDARNFRASADAILQAAVAA